MSSRLFVGRAGPMQALRSAARGAVEGGGALVLVSGEPGIGKTWLVEELTREAPALGLRTLWSSCWQGGGAPAFWPWIQVMRADAGERGAELLLPEEDEERFRLFDCVAERLRGVADKTPLLIVVDDLQWADPASLLLLRFLVPQLHGARLLVVGTYRDAEMDEQVRELIRGLAGSSQHLALTGLRPAEVGELAASVTGTPPSAERAAWLHQRTNGNPLFVRELARLLADGESADLRVPEGVREVIQRRLDRLSVPCQDVLAVAAVIGPRLRRRLLEVASGREEAQLVSLLAEASAARLVEEVPDAAGRWRFTHPLLVDVLTQGLAPSRRRELHHAVGQALEDLHRDDLEPRLAQLAHHFRLAGERAEPGRALAYTLGAGRRASRRLAHEEAAGHFAHALDMLAASSSRDRRLRCELLLSIAQARMAVGEVTIARGIYEQAAGLAREIGAGDLLARAALGVGVVTTAGIVDHLEVGLLVEALDAVEDADSALRTRLLARLARALQCTTSLERRRTLSDQAIEMARRVGDPATLAAAWFHRIIAVPTVSTTEEGLAISNEVVRLAGQAGEHELGFRARQVRMGYLLELGDMDAFRTELEVWEGLTRELGLARYAWRMPLVRSTLAVLAGRLGEAEILAEQGLRMGVAAQHPDVEVYHASIVLLVRSLRGTLPELEGVLRDYVVSRPGAAEWRSTLALALCDAGRDDEARQELDTVAMGDFANLAQDVARPHLLAILARTCAALGDERRAALLYPLLAPHGSHCIQVGGSAIGCFGSAAYYLGLLAGTMGRWDEAVERLDAAVEMNTRTGAWPFVANSRLALATALRAQGGAAALERAAEQADEAERMARAMGLWLWRRFAQAPAERLEMPDDAPLSGREWEVARLVAEGLRNAEIAERLFISKRTVESHVDHIRQKLGLGSRVALAGWVHHLPLR